MDKKISLSLFMLMVSIIIPLFGAYTLNLFEIKFVSIPLHTLLETAGAVMAFSLVTLIVIMGSKVRHFSHFHYSGLALISMGIFDLFHASTDPGELFVWLHSLGVFFGGLLFLSVWLKDRVVSKGVYYYIPIVVSMVSIGICVFYIMNPDMIPLMLENKEFSSTAILLNIIGGIAFIIAGINFFLIYLEDGEVDNLLFTGHTFLFGVSGILFASTTIWDLSWWLWHFMRFFAYCIALYYVYVIFIRNIKALEVSEHELLMSHKKLSGTLSVTREYQKALEVGSIVSKSDLSGKITYVNKNFCLLSGYSELELLGNSHKMLRHPNTLKDTYANMWKTIQNKQIWKGMIKNIKKNGRAFYTNITIVPILNKEDEVEEYLAFREDITELIKSKEELRNSFYTDTLTSLGNRFKLLDDIRDYTSPSLALINIDSFSEINDFYGQDLGDKLLIEFSHYLFEDTISRSYSLYRLHGDEFVILKEIYAKIDEQDFINNVSQIIENINNKTFIIDEFEIDLKVTASLAFGDKDKLLMNADIAYKVAKKSQHSLQIFNDSLHEEVEYKNNIIWSSKIKKAIEYENIVPYFQPIYDVRMNSITKYEVLMRLVDEENQVVSPFQFLDISKKSKQYFKLTRVIITKAFEVAKNNLDKEFSVNLSAEDIMNQNIRQFIKGQLVLFPKPENIIFEIVESEGIENFEEMGYFISWVKEHGAKIAIDDFGTGYSNFSYLIQLDADFIKIDGSLIKDIDTNQAHRSVVETIVAFARKNNMQVVAEYVWNKDVLDMIQELKIEYAQGYYLGEPKDRLVR
jgi:PAS domain S-box-containing protein/diguanylate cyclase (GGDEF)-like protein